MVILYHPRSARARFRLPMSLLALAGHLHPHHKVVIVDANLCYDPLTELRRHLREATGPCVLAVTVMPGPQLSRAIPHSRILKAEFPHIPLVWGGWFPSLHTETCLRSSFVDYVVRGRADGMIVALISGILSGQDVTHLPNLSFRVGSGFQHNPEGPLLHPDTLPPWPLDLAPPERYLSPTYLGSRTTAYHSSYGCPLRCGFCAVAAQYQGRWLSESVSHMMPNLEALFARGANGVEFCDNNFFVSEKRCDEFAEAMAGRGVGWWGEGTVEDLLSYNTSTLTRMYKSGLKMLFFGMESGDDDALRLMNKGRLEGKMALELATRFKEVGIVPEFSFCLGTPPNPSEGITKSIDLIRRIKAINPRAEIILYIYSPEPFLSADLWSQTRNAGFKHPTTLDEWETGGYDLLSVRRQVENPWLTAREVQHIYEFEAVLTAQYPSVSDLDVGPWARRGLRVASAFRYHTRTYRHPWELKALLKLAKLRHIEEEGFPPVSNPG